jgi:hypothetical protein
MLLKQIQEAIELIRMEYAEMPDMKLTFGQAQRLWSLSTEICERALDDLTRSGFLARTRDGSYVRRETQPVGGDAATPIRSM